MKQCALQSFELAWISILCQMFTNFTVYEQVRKNNVNSSYSWSKQWPICFMLRYIFITFHTGFKPLYSHTLTRLKSLHIEKNLFLPKKFRAIAITRNSRKSRNWFSGKFRIPSYFHPIRKNDNSEFYYDTVDSCLEVKIPSSKWSVFCPLPKNDNSEFFWVHQSL